MSSHSLQILLLIGTIFSFGVMYRWRNDLNLKWYTALVFSILHTIWGVISVSVFAVVETGFNMKYLGNMSLFGGVYMMPLFYLILGKITRTHLKTVFDVCLNCMLFTLMCARINCIISGCCFGLKIPGIDLRWPTRQMEILFYIILIAYIFKKLQSGKYDGTLYPFYMIVYGIFRLVTEGFRYYEGHSIIHRGHVWSTISILVGLSVYIEIRKNNIKRRKG